jgi:hypothetical protein
MITFELRPSPGVRDPFASKQSVRLRAKPRMALRRYTCPCGCQRTGWFTQPRSIRVSPLPVPATPEPVATRP